MKEVKVKLFFNSINTFFLILTYNYFIKSMIINLLKILLKFNNSLSYKYEKKFINEIN